MAYTSLKQLQPHNMLLHATASHIYTAPSSGSEIGCVWLHNIGTAGSSPCGVELYFPLTASADNTSGSYRKVSEVLVAGASLEISPKIPFTLTSGQQVWGKGVYASNVGIVLIGREAY